MNHLAHQRGRSAAGRRRGFACIPFLWLVLAPAHGQEDFRFFIKEYRIGGSAKLEPLEIQEIVYPYLGPARTAEDVEQARNALEEAYKRKGYQTVSVLIPQQDPRYGVIRLQVVEGKVGRLRVQGARWFLPSKVKEAVPSLAEGQVPNLQQVQKEIVAVNRLADRKVTPELRPGTEPGTVDIDLKVEDQLPLHGSLELNNRHNADTSELRLNGSLSYGNLFQLGHTGGISFQIAPEDLDDAAVFSGYYLARVHDTLSLMLQGTRQDSDISTLGGAAVGGRGTILGLRTLFDLPTRAGFYQSFSFGLDYKRFEEDLDLGEVVLSSPIEYYPFSANYGAAWIGENVFTELNAALTFHLRGMGSDSSSYAQKRYRSDGSFLYLRSDLSHTRDLASGVQWFGKFQGQLSNKPLINSEQFAGGGLGTARGYLEATALGDNGAFLTLELRSPSLIGVKDERGRWANEWRFHAFAEGGIVGIYDALPAQDANATFASIGFGTRFRLADHFNGSLDVALPLLEEGTTQANDPALLFRGWADF